MGIKHGETGRTECCDALTTFHDEIECCKVCWEEIIAVTYD